MARPASIIVAAGGEDHQVSQGATLPPLSSLSPTFPELKLPACSGSTTRRCGLFGGGFDRAANSRPEQFPLLHKEKKA